MDAQKNPRLRRRNRIINFRLNDEEYEEMRQACLKTGTRCISEFARVAVLQMARAEVQGERPLENRFRHLDHALSNLAVNVGYLVELLEHSEARERPALAPAMAEAAGSSR